MIVGLDIGRSTAVAAALDYFPANPKRYFNEHRRNFVRLNTSIEGIEQLLSLNPTALVMEPTGNWYSAFWREFALSSGIPAYWVGHADLSHQRGSYGFVNKRDDEDAFCLALCYFDERFIDIHGRKRFIWFESGTCALLRQKFLELEQIDKNRTALVNQLRQRLTLEFPEIATRKFSASQKLGFTPVLGALAGIHTYTRIENELKRSCARTLGIEISDFTSDHALAICTMELRERKIKRALAHLLEDPEFSPYLKVFAQFGFGVRMQALMLSQVYPFEKFLIDGKRYIEWEEDAKGKLQKRDRSLRSFQAYMGLSYSLKQSGDKKSKRFHGSTIVRSHLYAWALSVIAPQPPKRLNTSIGHILGEKFDSLRTEDSPIPGKDSFTRVLFKTTALLFRELRIELHFD